MIIFSDLHLEPKSREVALEVLRRIPEICARHGDGHVVFLGDFWMVRHTLSVKLLLEAHDVLRSWAPVVHRCDVVPGNHDQVDTAGRNALEVFDSLSGFTVHTRPCWSEFGFFLPWLHDKAEALAVLQMASAEPKGPSVLFAHLAVDGAWMNNLRKNTDGVAITDLNAWKKVFLGHYHRHQVLRKGAIYIGSPYEVSYAEAGQPKGYVHFDGTISRFHKLDIGPRHHKFVIDADHPGQAILPTGLGPQDKLWVQVKGQAAGVMSSQVSQVLKKAGIEADRIEVDLQPTQESARLKVDAGDSSSDLALRYLEAQDMDAQYKELLVETFRRLDEREL